MLSLPEDRVLRDLRVLDGIVKASGRRLVLHPTFSERFSRLPYEVAKVHDDRGFIRLVLNDEMVVPVVIETQRPSGYAAAECWPRTFVGLRASGRPFAVVTRGVHFPLAIRLEGDSEAWGHVSEIRDGSTISAVERPTPPAAVSMTEAIELHEADEDAYEALELERVRRAEEARAEYAREQASVPPIVIEEVPSGTPSVASQADDALQRSHEEAPWAEQLFTVIVEDEWYAVSKQHRGRTSTYTVEVGGVECEYSLLDDLLDATLPRSSVCEIIGPIDEDDAVDLLRRWVERHPELDEPYIFDAGDERWAVIRLEDGLAVVPGCLEGNGRDNDLDELTRRKVIETVWSFVANWDTGAVTSFQYLEDLVRYGDIYYFLVWRESGSEIHRLGRFTRESDARLLAASKFSEAEHYRELAEMYPDPDYD